MARDNLVKAAREAWFVDMSSECFGNLVPRHSRVGEKEKDGLEAIAIVVSTPLKIEREMRQRHNSSEVGQGE
jgi:hypothetical protein